MHGVSAQQLVVFNAVDQQLRQLHQQQAYQQAKMSMIVFDTRNDSVLYRYHDMDTLPPASTLKTLTTAAAMDVLGSSFQFQTRITFQGKIKQQTGYGKLIVYAGGDPSLGSDRFPETHPNVIFQHIQKGLQKLGIRKLVGVVQVLDTIFSDTAIHPTWLDEDIGNYYGAGVYGLNWKENKFDLELTPLNNSFVVTRNTGGLDNTRDVCIELIPRDDAGTEQSYAYLVDSANCRYALRGFLTTKSGSKTLQLASTTPGLDFKAELTKMLSELFAYRAADTAVPGPEKTVVILRSPPLKKLIYACNQKSINLYAEAFCKMMGQQQGANGNWKHGIQAMLGYCFRAGIDTGKIRLQDASGLSVQNRINVHSLASLLLYAKQQPWYPLYRESLPLINGLRMKSGYIGGTRAYTGFIMMPHKQEVCFSFIVSGYSAPAVEVKQRMFEILNLLK
jgi:D-alanyl-D-alanine carboxypeptidase/D-alanyl-D-alanine-endopeptidase (penicillin-binding protein 4)